MLTHVNALLMADGLIDTGTNLTHQIEKGVISAISAYVVFRVLQEFVRGGMVAGLIALVLGGAIFWGAGHMDFFKDQAGKTVDSALSEHTRNRDAVAVLEDPHGSITLAALISTTPARVDAVGTQLQQPAPQLGIA